MFLEYGKAPHVNAMAVVPSDNEYSVFGPTPQDANLQVSELWIRGT